MKVALKLSIVVWMIVSATSFGAVLYLLPSYGITGAFEKVFKIPVDPELVHLSTEAQFHA
jgi:hypothetical protein